MGCIDYSSSLFDCCLSSFIQRKQLFTYFYVFVFFFTWNLHLSRVRFPSVRLPFNNSPDRIRIQIRKCVLFEYQDWSRSTSYALLPNWRRLHIWRHCYDGKGVLESYVHSFQRWLQNFYLSPKLCDVFLLEVRYKSIPWAADSQQKANEIDNILTWILWHSKWLCDHHQTSRIFRVKHNWFCKKLKRSKQLQMSYFILLITKICSILHRTQRCREGTWSL